MITIAFFLNIISMLITCQQLIVISRIIVAFCFLNKFVMLIHLYRSTSSKEFFFAGLSFLSFSSTTKAFSQILYESRTTIFNFLSHQVFLLKTDTSKSKN